MTDHASPPKRAVRATTAHNESGLKIAWHTAAVRFT